MPGAAPDASVGAGSGNCPARQAGSFAGTAHRAVPKRSALHIAGPLAGIKNNTARQLLTLDKSDIIDKSLKIWGLTDN